jgi:uncharacterized damage-inducible protein DinB
MVAQSSPSADVKNTYNAVKDLILRSAEKMPEDQYGYRPTAEVRTYAALLGHIADASYTMCAAAKGEPRPEIKVEKTRSAKAELVAALKEAYAFCDAAYSALNDENASEPVKLFGRERSRAGWLNFNLAHTYEHYGNLVTYMRMKGLVPPSSERRQ